MACCPSMDGGAPGGSFCRIANLGRSFVTRTVLKDSAIVLYAISLVSTHGDLGERHSDHKDLVDLAMTAAM